MRPSYSAGALRATRSLAQRVARLHRRVSVLGGGTSLRRLNRDAVGERCQDGRVDVATHIAQLDEHGHALADAAERAGLDTDVPTCPRWDVRALLAHIGMVHRWATTHVREGKGAFAENTEGPHFPAPDEGVVDWYRRGHADLLDALHAAPDDLDAMTFLADAGTARAFWARRQAHETAIHRADAEAATGSRPDFDQAFALDGVAELLEGFYSRRGGTLLADPPISLRVSPDDTEVSWLIELAPEQRTITRDGTGDADCTVTGPVAPDVRVHVEPRGCRRHHRRPARSRHLALAGQGALALTDGDRRQVGESCGSPSW